MKTLLVIGKINDDILQKFNVSNKVEPYKISTINEISRAKKNHIEYLEECCLNEGISNNIKENFSQQIQKLNKISDIDYLKIHYPDTIIDSNGDIFTTKNPDGKFKQIFYNEDTFPKLGTEEFIKEGLKREINWDKIHLNKEKQELFKHIWLITHNSSVQLTNEDKRIINNIVKIPNYFDNFKNEYEYILYNTSFWAYAVLFNGIWHDMDEVTSANIWITTFFDTYIKNLTEDTFLTLYYYQ